MLQEIPSQVYLRFYDILLNEFVARELNGKTYTDARKVWWEKRVDDQGESYIISKKLFGNGKEYFWDKKNKIEVGGLSTIRVNTAPMIKALLYLGYTLRKRLQNNLRFQEKERFDHLLYQFSEDYPVEEFTSDSEEDKPNLKKGVKSKKETNLDSYTERYKRLNGKVFISDIAQGDVVDKAVLTIRTIGNYKFEGEMDVLYVDETKMKYLKRSYPLTLKGDFLYNDVLLFIYDNPHPEMQHAGVFKLEYDASSSRIDGGYVAYFRSMHPKRKSHLGQACFIETDPNAAKFFLSNAKGKPMTKRGAEFEPHAEIVNPLQNYPSIPEKIK